VLLLIKYCFEQRSLQEQLLQRTSLEVSFLQILPAIRVKKPGKKQQPFSNRYASLYFE
jgi:hypothetical protein